MSYQQGGRYDQSYDDNYGAYPQHDPFSDRNRFDAQPQQSYPPQQQYGYGQQQYGGNYQAQQSHDDFDDVGPGYGAGGAAAAGGASGGYGAAGDRVSRDSTNPYAQDYKGSNHVKRWIAIIVGVLILAGIATGIAVWRVNANKNNSTSSDSSSNQTDSNGLAYITGTARAVKSNPDDPSDFQKDDRLHQSFYAMCYTPFLAQEPWCGATLANVTEDIQQLSQLTTRLRMYGAACEQSALTLQAIEDTKVNMTVWLGVYIGSNETVNEEQKVWTLDVLQKYGTDHVSGVTVGNEYIHNQDDQATATEYIVSHMNDFRTRLAALNLAKTIPVGTADVGSVVTAALAAGADYVMSNVHPFFGGLLIDDAAGWTWEYFENNDVPITTAASIPGFIAEVGWPSDSMTEANRTYEGAVAGVPELQTFLDTYPCAANTNQSQYFYFSPYDEPWKEQFGGVEPYWGLFDSNKVLKDITLPNCGSTP